jgi:MYXO-CTERM domain-containing protein
MRARLMKVALVAVSIGLASALPSNAQTTAADRADRAVTRVDNNFDWGWLGLLGLAGLFGLRRRKDRDDYPSNTTTGRPAR